MIRGLLCALMLLSVLVMGCDGDGSDDPTFDPALAERLDSLLAEELTDWGVPGAVELVRSPEGALHLGAAGVSEVQDQALAPGVPAGDDALDLGLGFLSGPDRAPPAPSPALTPLPGPYPGLPMGTERIFRLCSLTKTFTATLVFMLVDQGRLSLSDTVFDLLGDVVPGSDVITVDMLLTHYSGLYDYGRDPLFLAMVLDDPARVWSPRELVDFAAAREPPYPPGGGYSYASTNYVLLGMILEAVSGERWQDLVASRITAPLGLSRIVYPDGPGLPEGASRGYMHLFGLRDVTDIDPSAGWAAGGLAGNLKDTERWFAALLSGRLLSEASRAAMFDFLPTNDPELFVGRGVFKESGTLGHSGMVLGFQASMQERDGWRVIVLTNANPPGDRIWQNAAQAMDFDALDLIFAEVAANALAAALAR